MNVQELSDAVYQLMRQSEQDSRVVEELRGVVDEHARHLSAFSAKTTETSTAVGQLTEAMKVNDQELKGKLRVLEECLSKNDHDMKGELAKNDLELKEKLRELETQIRQSMADLASSLRSERPAETAPSGHPAGPNILDPNLELKIKAIEFKVTNLETRAERGEERLKGCLNVVEEGLKTAHSAIPEVHTRV